MSSRRPPSLSRDADGAASRSHLAEYSALARSFSVSSPTVEIAAAVELMYDEMRGGTSDRGTLPIEIRVVEPPCKRYGVSFGGRPCFEAEGLGDLLHQLVNHLTVALDKSLAQMNRARQVALGPLALLAHDDQVKPLAAVEALLYLLHVRLLDPRLGLVHELEKSGRMLGHRSSSREDHAQRTQRAQ